MLQVAHQPELLLRWIRLGVPTKWRAPRQCAPRPNAAMAALQEVLGLRGGHKGGHGMYLIMSAHDFLTAKSQQVARMDTFVSWIVLGTGFMAGAPTKDSHFPMPLKA